MSIRNRWIDSAENGIVFVSNSFGRLSSLEREPKGREWWGENMFTIIKCRFHSSYGLRCKRTYYIRIAFRHDFFPSSLIVFFVIREESHHSFNRSMTSTIFRTKKKKKEKKGNNWNYRDSFSLYLFFSLFTTLVLQSMEFSGKRLEISEKREIYRLFFLPILIFFTYIFTIQKIILNCPAYTFLSKSTILCHEAFKEISNLTRRIIIEEQSKESFFD